MRLSELVPIIQLSISPVILISGVGLLLLSMTNRLGRLIDRSRQLAEAERNNALSMQGGSAALGADHLLLMQVKILARRARKLQLAIMLASTSVLLAALLVVSLFLSALFNIELAVFIAAIFITCMVTLIGALVLFIMDINLTMRALDLELGSIMAYSQRLPKIQ